MNKKFLMEYLSTNAPSTFEVEGQKVWKDYIEKFVDSVEVDNYGTVIAKILSKNKDNKNKPYKVLIDAHADEIGFIVKRITDDGYIYTEPMGGIDYDIVIGLPVNIMTDNGLVKGIFGWIPIHQRDATNPDKPTKDKVFIDVGASSKKEVEDLGIEQGNFIVFDRKPEILNEKYLVSKSLDDKIGGFVIAEVARTIKEKGIDLPFDLYIVNTVQEEVGLRGATMVTNNINPDVNITIDVCFDNTNPLVSKTKYDDTKIGEGIILANFPAVQQNLLKLMKKVAKKNNIKHQIRVGSGRHTGTNTDAYNLSNGGVISGLVSIPLRYMHTPNEIVHMEDVESAITFYIKLLKKIDYQHDFKYL